MVGADAGISRAGRKNGQAVDAADALPKSFVLTQEYGEQRIYLTRANAAVLQRRMAEE